MTRVRTLRVTPRTLVALATLTVGIAFFAAQAGPASSDDGVSSASGFLTFKFAPPQPGCTGGGINTQPSFAFDRNDCGFVTFALAGNATTAGITVRLYHPDTGAPFATLPVTFRAPPQDGRYQFNIRPDATWPSGIISYEVFVPGETGPAGGAFFRHNFLGADVAVTPKPSGADYAPGEDLPVTGSIYELNSVPDSRTPVAATYELRVVTPTGDVRGPYGPFTANQGAAGQFSQTIPGAATAGLTETVDLAVQVVEVEYDDASPPLTSTGRWASKIAGATGTTINVPVDVLVLENSFASAVGWVKPGVTYPFRIFVKNFRSNEATNATVTVTPADGMVFTSDLVPNSGTATIDGAGNLVWTIPNVPAAPVNGSTILTLVGVGEADTTAEDLEIVWKDLSTTATLTYDDGPPGLTSKSHGPRVIPADERFDTARYGDRPFPVVPVDYFDRKHEPNHTGDALSKKINSPDIVGSTFNLYQEMSFGQLFPSGTVPSSNFASADWNVQWNSQRYRDSGFQFTTPMPGGACTGVSYAAAAGTPVYQERIHDGWYQMPGDTGYYGSDRSTIAGAVVIGASEIDSACGPTSKAVYDAAHIADPEIDYSDYDTDKDGVVDFFMMVFPGVGGNLGSQTQIPPYDNIWPHSFTLEAQYEDEETGLTGYISDDQLKDLKGRPLYYTNAQRTTMTTDVTDFPVPVRVGPYNVNPEAAIDHASVISHEYGHSLGLPDFYSGPPTNGRETYGDWSLMATDKSHHMDVFAKQELGWIVPRELPAGSSIVENWRDSKLDTHQIQWRRPDGTPYTLEGPEVHNAEAYKAALPPRKLIDPAKIAAGASPDHVWWSANGDDFGCPPDPTGHSLDIALPELANAAPGSTVKLRFKSYWDIEWDFDYGFVLLTTDDGQTYRSISSANGYSTPQAFNPNRITCQTRYGNGLTGTSASAAAGTQASDRLPINNVYADGGFLQDEYDISSAAGSPAAVRLAYFTDGGFIRPGWFIDDLQVLVNGEVIYETNFENGPDEPHVFNGGCNADNVSTGPCSVGWRYVDGSVGSAADHAYYIEMRDRSGFDMDGHGENDRDPIGFQPGLLLEYTDEQHGYGNYATPDPPAQSQVDSQPQPGNRTPALNDAAWTEVIGDSAYSDTGEGHTDNYTDPENNEVDPRYPDVPNPWRFRHDCLSFNVLSMSGRGIGPPTVPGDLIGDVQFTMGPGCVYTGGEQARFGPNAVIQTRPENATIREGDDLTLDGSGSRDDLTPPEQLRYEWDFENDGIWDAMGQTVVHRYNVPGIYTARLRVTDGDGLTDIASVPVTVNPFCETTTFSDDLEPTAEAGWAVQTETNANPGSPNWQQQTDVAAQSPTHSWFSDAAVLELKDDRLLAPAEELGPTSRLTFWHRFNFESGFDGGVLEVSTDGGATWRDVLDAGGTFVEGGYNDTISTAFGSPIAGRSAWSGGPLDAAIAPMEQVIVNVGALSGQSARFRFRLAADPFGVGALPGQGWWIDDFAISGIPQPCNRPPLAVDDSASTIEATAVTIDVVANDSDPEGQPLSVTAVTQPSNGTVVNNGDGTVTYTPDGGFVSPPDDLFTYTVSDGENSVDARVTVTVNTLPNGAPVAGDDSAETTEEVAVTIVVLDNDSDPDGDALTVDATTQPAHGSAGTDGSTVTYTPSAGFVGTDTFDYTVGDGKGGADTGTVTVTVNPRPNRAPDAVDDSAATQRDTPVTIGVTANDSDPDGDPLSITGVSDPGHGTAVDNGNGTVTYTPDSGFTGDDSFTYSVADGRGGSDTATVAVTVAEPPNRPPTARNDTATVKKNKSVRVSVLANDTDPDGDTLTVTQATDPPHGTVAIDRGLSITYRPDHGFVGTDTFTYEVSDGKGGVAVAQVTITVRHDNGN
jgi:immune inhibitor A